MSSDSNAQPGLKSAQVWLCKAQRVTYPRGTYDLVREDRQVSIQTTVGNIEVCFENTLVHMSHGNLKFGL